MDTDKTLTHGSAAFRPLHRANTRGVRGLKQAKARAPSESVFIGVHPWLNSSLFGRPDDFVQLRLESHRQRVGDDTFN